MNSVPWWALPLVAGVFALAGALVAQLVTARHAYVARAVERRNRWYEERREVYVTLLTAYERVIARLRHDQQTKDYLARRIREGKSKKEAIRCLKRYVAREVFAALQP